MRDVCGCDVERRNGRWARPAHKRRETRDKPQIQNPSPDRKFGCTSRYTQGGSRMGTKKVLTSLLVIALLAAPAMSVMAQGDGPVEAEPGQELDMILLPKDPGNPVFVEANNGAMEAHEELENPGELIFTGPTP